MLGRAVLKPRAAADRKLKAAADRRFKVTVERRARVDSPAPAGHRARADFQPREHPGQAERLQVLAVRGPRLVKRPSSQELVGRQATEARYRARAERRAPVAPPRRADRRRLQSR